MNRPKCSIVTISDNTVQGLRRTIASVAKQSEPDIEHVVVDGNSSDGTRHFLENELQNSLVDWTSERDSGIYNAMNKGLARCTHDLIMVVNAGDQLRLDSSLATIVDHYTEHRWAWAYGGVRLIDSSQTAVGAYVFDPFQPDRFVLGINWIPHATVIMTRELIERLKCYREDLGTVADQEFLMRALKLSQPHTISELLIDYEIDGLSYQLGPRAREIAWHRMREETDNLLGKSLFLDRVYTELRASFTSGGRLARTLYKKVRE